MRIAVLIGASLMVGCVDDPPAASLPSGGALRLVHVSWTNSHQPADAATCYAHPSLTVRLHVMPIGGETIAYAPVPCAEGLFTVQIPVRFVDAEVATIESSMGVPIDDNGYAAVDLTDWQR